jgi:hypothetical protein
MEIAVKILQWELQDALSAEAEQGYVDSLRHAIMVLNKNLFHQKIMGSDPTNKYYAKAS